MNHFRPGMRFEISKVDEPDVYFVSSLHEVQDGFLVFACPYRQRFPLILEPGDQVYVRSGAADAVYAFTSFVSHKVAGDTLLYVVEYPASVERVQRREFARVDTLFDVRIWGSPEEMVHGTADGEPGQVTNISGGGLRLECKAAPEPDQLVALTFTLPVTRNRRTIEVTGRVVRVVPSGKRKGFYEVSVRFKDIRTGDQDRIVGFILSEMSRQKHLFGNGE